MAKWCTEHRLKTPRDASVAKMPKREASEIEMPSKIIAFCAGRQRWSGEINFACQYAVKVLNKYIFYTYIENIHKDVFLLKHINYKYSLL
jgi:hypothetical protein